VFWPGAFVVAADEPVSLRATSGGGVVSTVTVVVVVAGAAAGGGTTGWVEAAGCAFIGDGAARSASVAVMSKILVLIVTFLFVLAW
jgi:hypothetical protein